MRAKNCLKGAHQQAGITGWPQPHIGFVEFTGGHFAGQDMNDALPQAGKKHVVINALVAVGDAAGIRIMDEHQIQIRARAAVEG